MKIKSISLFDAISNTQYKNETKEYLVNLLFEAYFEKKNSKFFLIQKQCPETNFFFSIISIKFTLFFTNRLINELNLLIYFHRSFPEKAPEIYLERMDNTAISSYCSIVDKQNYQVQVNSLKNWNKNVQFNVILDEIHNSFIETFPLSLKKILPSDLEEIKKDFCDFDYNKAVEVILDGDHELNFVDHSNDLNKKNVSEEFKKNYWNEENLKKFIENEVFVKISQNLINRFELLKMREKYLMNQIDQIKERNNSIIEILDEKKEFIETLKRMIEENKQKTELIQEINENFTKFEQNFENFENSIEIENIQNLEIISNECVIEDTLITLRKGIEKGSIDFIDSIKLHRNLSRELFKLKHVRLAKELKNK